MFYTQITNSTSGNPRFLIECPLELTGQEAKKEFGFKIATEKQIITIKNARRSVYLCLIASTYDISELINKMKSKKYTFDSDDLD